MRGLEGASIIVTGAAGGIGRAIVKRLAQEQCRVGVLDIAGAPAQELALQVRDTGGAATAFAVDITDYTAVQAAVQEFLNLYGRIDGLVNNAGWDIARPFLDTEPEFWRKVVDINLYGPLNMNHVVLRHMVERGAGRVVNIASDAGRVGSSGEAVYSAAKGGVIALSKTLARELAGHGITLNSVCPGPTDTPLLASFDSSPDGRLTKALIRAIPMKRLAQPEDIPGLVAFLLSDDAGFITGQTMSISGGLSMQG